MPTFCTSFGDDYNVKKGAIGESRQLWVCCLLERRTKEAQCPRYLRVLDASLAGCSQNRLGSSSAVEVCAIVVQLANGSVVKKTTVLVPELNARGKLSLCSNACEVSLSHLVLVRVQER